MIDIQIDSTNVINALKRLEQATLKRAPLMRSIAGIMADAVEENFAQQGRPKWQGLKPPGRPGGQILQKSGRLAASIAPASDADSAQVGTLVGANVKYAAIHQFGGKTAAHEIRPRHAKALRFGGRFAKKVNHPGSDIPARPFLALGETDLQAIEETVSDYLRAALGE